MCVIYITDLITMLSKICHGAGHGGAIPIIPVTQEAEYCKSQAKLDNLYNLLQHLKQKKGQLEKYLSVKALVQYPGPKEKKIFSARSFFST